MYVADTPRPPTSDGGAWVSMIIDTRTGDSIPTGSIHSSVSEAWSYSQLTAHSWNKTVQPKRTKRWWQFWKAN